jgi:hypothetical protein
LLSLVVDRRGTAGGGRWRGGIVIMVRLPLPLLPAEAVVVVVAAVVVAYSGAVGE